MNLICECATVYAVGVTSCPQCGSTVATADHPTPGYHVAAGELVPDAGPVDPAPVGVETASDSTAPEGKSA